MSGVDIYHDQRLPAEKEQVAKQARRYEYITIAYMSSVVILMYLVMGGSQAMRTAWFEDMLSLIPPVVFLIASHMRSRKANDRFPYGYHRVMAIAFLCASLALLSMGLFLLYESLHALIMREHPTIGIMTIWGRHFWSGWAMIAVLIYSVIGPVLLGLKKLKLAAKLDSKVLYADAKMNKADWTTGSAAAVGIIGIAWGFWWADSAAAALISLDVTRDGVRNMRNVVGDLVDRRPVDVAHQEYSELPSRLEEELRALPWVKDVAVRLREYGEVIFGEAFILPNTKQIDPQWIDDATRLAYKQDWRLYDFTVTVLSTPRRVDPLQSKDAQDLRQ